MKPTERFPPDDPREWMNRARSHLARAASRIPGVYLEDLCFDAQQPAEKAANALLIRRGVRLLPTLFEEAGGTVPEVVR